MNLYCHSCKSYRAGGTCVNPKRKGDETGYFSPVCCQFEDITGVVMEVRIEKMRTCRRCYRTLPLSAFTNRHHRVSYQSICNDCQKAQDGEI